jgi:hypothetical protein
MMARWAKTFSVNEDISPELKILEEIKLAALKLI